MQWWNAKNGDFETIRLRPRLRALALRNVVSGLVFIIINRKWNYYLWRHKIKWNSLFNIKLEIWMMTVDWRAFEMCALISKSKLCMNQKKSHDRTLNVSRSQFLTSKWSHGDTATIQSKRYISMSRFAIFKNTQNVFTLSLVQGFVIFFWITQDCNALLFHLRINRIQILRNYFTKQKWNQNIFGKL